MTKEDIAYRLGGLLYMPPFQRNIVEKIKLGEMPFLTSVAFCLEDAIMDSAVQESEIVLKKQLDRLSILKDDGIQVPYIFVRVRNPEHLKHLQIFLGATQIILTGYILPKFSQKNADAYCEIAQNMRQKEKNIFFMPVLETKDIASTITRAHTLSYLKEKIDSIQDNILCIRVGANDFSQIYNLRCPPNHTIHELRLIDNILISILSVFANNYIVAGPVRNYFHDVQDISWKKFYKKELSEDRLMGFIGKTAIHPAQLPLIYDSLRVTQIEYTEAKQLSSWQNMKLGVVKSEDGGMSEVKCQSRWAERILKLAEIYGVKRG